MRRQLPRRASQSFPQGPESGALKDNTYLFSEFLARHCPETCASKNAAKALVQIHCHHYSVLGTGAERKSWTAWASTMRCCHRAAAEWPAIRLRTPQVRPIDAGRRTGDVAKNTRGGSRLSSFGGRIQLPRADRAGYRAEDPPFGRTYRGSALAWLEKDALQRAFRAALAPT